MTIKQRVAVIAAVTLVLDLVEDMEIDAISFDYNSSFAAITVNGDQYAIGYDSGTGRIRLALLPEGGGPPQWDDSGAVLMRRLLTQSSSLIQHLDPLLQSA
jgi:hypothetical protein